MKRKKRCPIPPFGADNASFIAHINGFGAHNDYFETLIKFVVAPSAYFSYPFNCFSAPDACLALTIFGAPSISWRPNDCFGANNACFDALNAYLATQCLIWRP